MRQHLNTLFVTTQGAYLAKESETVVVRVDREVRLRIPLLAIEGIVCFGQVTLSPYLMSFCGERGVAITFLSENGRFLARVLGPTRGNVLLRREQYRRTDDPRATASIAKAIVAAKIVSSRGVLQRALRERVGSASDPGLTAAISTVAALLTQLASLDDLDAIRGIEGMAARVYFEVFDALIIQQREHFSFGGRSRRPPRDPVNAVLSFVYTLLVHDVRAALETVGLDPYVGFLHRERPGRPSLALDLMEEFRPWLADRLVLSLINLKQIAKGDLVAEEAGGFRLQEEARKVVLVAYQKRKQEEIQHSFLAERVSVGMIPHLQATLLARFLRGDIEAYPPFVVR